MARKTLSIMISFLIITIYIAGCSKSHEYSSSTYEMENELLTRAINLNCKYVLTKWWYEKKDIAFQGSYLPNAKPLTVEQQIVVEDSVASFSNWKNEEYLFIPNWEKIISTIK